MEEANKRKRGRPPKAPTTISEVVEKNRTTPVPEKKLPGDNSKYLAVGIEVAALPKLDWSDARRVRQRVREYFEICQKHDMKPAVSGLAMAFGTDRRRLWEIATEQKKGGKYKGITAEGADEIKKAYQLLENLWENYMLNGKINPASGIFIGKNQFGYRDVQENVVIPQSPMGEERSREELEQRYIRGLPDSVDEKKE